MKKQIFRTLLFFCLLLIARGPIWGQPCQLNISGYVLDQGSNIPLPYAQVFVEETKRGAVADSVGYFQLKNLCPKAYHLRISHIGCEPEELYIALTQDTMITIYLHHHAELLSEVEVHGKREANSTQVSGSIGREGITRESHKNLSDLLANVAGVSVLKNGSGVSKPVVHGLFGNRVAILNNGIAQAGQQWGNDHAPEIDPFAADHLSVIKGASALAYPGNSLGSVVLVEMDKVKQDPHLHGNINYIFESNGMGHTLNTRLSQNSEWAAWRFTGTLKLMGDQKAPDYYLTNTGKREANFAVQLDKSFSPKFKANVYYSLFNTEIGILRGAHIGNTTDLEVALHREEPFFTNEKFAYQIEAPRQVVQHHLLKLEGQYFISDSRVLKVKYGGQLNDREEYDVRRGGRSDQAALSLQQYTHFLEATYNQTNTLGQLIKTGLQFHTADNENQPGTGVLPLIPDYRSYTGSAFAIFQKEQDKWFYEIGGRYDWKHWRVATISRDLPRRIERFNHTFHNASFSGGSKYQVTDHFDVSFNLGYMQRAPEVNELYSYGLHQGVSGIEEGNRNLVEEKSIKALLSADWNIKNKVFVKAVAYYQNINNYIYLQPQEVFRLTIRGAFPVFLYQQTDAQIYGTDLIFTYEPKDNLKFTANYALVRGDDLDNKLPLVYIPSDNLSTSLTYSLPDYHSWKKTSFSINARYTFEQWHLEPGQDFLAPPEGYLLLGVNAETQLQLKASKFQLSFSVENLLNTRYRDYLNRLRYFADDVGVNVLVRVGYVF